METTQENKRHLSSVALVSACAGRESRHYIMMHLSKRRFVFWETDVPCSCWWKLNVKYETHSFSLSHTLDLSRCFANLWFSNVAC